MKPYNITPPPVTPTPQSKILETFNATRENTIKYLGNLKKADNAHNKWLTDLENGFKK